MNEFNINELVGLIEEANAHYALTGENLVPDSTFEEWTRQLKSVNPKHPALNFVAPEVSSLGKVIHQTPMLSLNKVYSVEDLKKWMNKVARTEDEGRLTK